MFIFCNLSSFYLYIIEMKENIARTIFSYPYKKGGLGL
nr:MAG TPA: hypothetical protein [Caudoviricetes sp.]